MEAASVTESPEDSPNISHWSVALQALLIIVLAFIAYWPVKDCGFVWDDDDYVFENELLTEPGGLARIWTQPTASPQYYPLVFTSFWVEARLWGTDQEGRFVARGFHLTNVFFHGLGAVMFWLVLRRLKVPGAWLAAAVFAVHPVMVESVAWISERKNVLAGMFYFSSLLAYLQFTPLQGSASARKWGWYVASLLCFVLALTSKSITCTLPAAILVLTWWRAGRLRWRDVVPTLPMFVMGASYGMITVWMEKHVVWAGETPEPMSFVERVLVAGRVSWFYAAKVIWPTELIFVYPRWVVQASQWTQWLYPVTAILLLALAWMMRGRVGRGPLAGVLLFGGTLFPAMGFFDVYPLQFSYVADHYQYVAAAWLIAVLVAIGATVIKARGWWDPIALRMISIAIIVPLTALTWKQQPIYQSLETLCEDTINRNPDCWMAHSNLCVVRLMQGRVDEALTNGSEVVRLKPGHYPGRLNYGTALMTKGLPREAEEQFRAAVGIRPDSGAGHMNLAMTLEAQGRDQQALIELRDALKLDPTLMSSAEPIVALLLQKGKRDLALAVCDLALEVEPTNVRVQEQREAILRQR